MTATPASAPTTTPEVVRKAAGGHALEPRGPSFLPEPTTFSVEESLAAVSANSGGAAALAAVVLVAIALRSWIALLLARTLTAPSLSFALQRPG